MTQGQSPSLFSPTAAFASLPGKLLPCQAAQLCLPQCLSYPSNAQNTTMNSSGGFPTLEAGVPKGNRALLWKPELQLGPISLLGGSTLRFTETNPPPLPNPAAPSTPRPCRGHWYLPTYEHPNSEPAAQIYPSLQTPSAGPWNSEPCPRPWSPGPCSLSPARGDCFTGAPQKQGTPLLRVKPRPVREKTAFLMLTAALRGRMGSACSPDAAAGSLQGQAGHRFLQPCSVTEDLRQHSWQDRSQPTPLIHTMRQEAPGISLSLCAATG